MGQKIGTYADSEPKEEINRTQKLCYTSGLVKPKSFAWEKARVPGKKRSTGITRVIGCYGGNPCPLDVSTSCFSYGHSESQKLNCILKNISIK